MPAAVAFVGGMFSFGAGAAFAAGGAAFSGWVAGAAFSGTVIGGLTAKLLSSVALSALASAVSKKPQQGGGLTITATVHGEQNPETIIVGRYATGGQAVCPPYSHGKSNRYLTHVVELCSAPGAALDRVMIGDEWVTLGESAHPDYGRPVSSGKYSGLIWIKYHDGHQTVADPMMRTKYGNHVDRPWTADMVGAGLCYAILTFQYHKEKLAQVPRYRFEVLGLPLYDIRKDSSEGGNGPQRLHDPETWVRTDNPAVIIWNLLRGIPLPGGEIYGGNIGDLRRLPRDVWVAAMNKCDIRVETDDGDEAAFRAGLEIALDAPPAAAIEELEKAASATISDLGYGWGIVVGAPGLPVYAFSDADVIVSRTQELDPWPGLQDTYNAVSARFPDPSNNWDTKEAPQRTNAEWEASDAFGRRTAALALPAVPYADQVQRLMRAWIEDERRFRRHIISLPPDSAHVELSDVIDWTSEYNGYDGKDFSVEEVLEDPRTGIRQFSIRERDPLDYHWKRSFTLPKAPAAAPPRLRQPLIVDGFDAQAGALKDATGKVRRVHIDIIWDPDILADGLRWEIRLAQSSTAVLRGDTQDLAPGWLRVAEGILPDINYAVRARLIADKETEWTSWIELRTDQIGFSWEDFSAELRADLEASQARIDAAEAEAAAAAAAVQEAINEAQAAMEAVAGARSDALAAAGEAMDLAHDNLALARGYTDTSVQTATAALETELGQLAASIREITAANTGDNLLNNGNFADGLTHWTIGSATVAAEAATVTAQLGQTVIPPGGFMAGNLLQWRVDHRGAAGYVRVQFLDAASAPVGAEIATPFAASSALRIASAQHTPPVDAAGFRWRVTTSGSVTIDNVVATTVDQQLFSRLATAEVALVNLGQSLANYQQALTTRIDGVESSLVNDYLTRAQTNSAISTASTALTTQINGVKTTVTQQQTTLSNLLGGIASFSLIAQADGASGAGIEAVSINQNGQTTRSALKLIGDDVFATGTFSAELATFGTGKNLLVDPSFEDGLTHWAAGGGHRSVGVSTGTYHPASPVISVGASTTAGQASYLFCRPTIDAAGQRVLGVGVTPGEYYFLSARMRISGGGMDLARLIIVWRTATGDAISSAGGTWESLGYPGLGNAGGWRRISMRRQAPAGAALAECRFVVSPDAGAAHLLHVYQPQFEQAHAYQTEPSPWSPGGTTLVNGGRVTLRSLTGKHLEAGTITATELINTAKLITQSAQMEDLIVGTIKIANNAVVQYLPARTAGNIAIGSGSGWTTVQSLTFTSAANRPSVIGANVGVVSAEWRSGSASGTYSSREVQLRLLRGSTLMDETSGRGGLVVFEAIDGTATYQLQARFRETVDTSTGGSEGDVSYYTRYPGGILNNRFIGAFNAVK